MTLESAGADSSDFSPLVGDIRFNLTRNVRTDGFINWNWDENQVDHWRVGASFDRDIRRRLSTSYSWYDTSDSLQLDFTWPIASRWQLGATALRSDSDDSEPGYYSKVTVGYDACCWAIQLGYEDRSDGSDQKSQSKFMATFSLRGLGRVSSDQLAGGFTTSVPSLN